MPLININILAVNTEFFVCFTPFPAVKVKTILATMMALFAVREPLYPHNDGVVVASMSSI